MTESVRCSLPMPPSANRLWRVMRGRPVKSDAYREWLAHVAACVTPPPAPIDWFTVSIALPASRRDPDNAIKPLLDALQRVGVLRNDSMLRGLTLDIVDSIDTRVEVEVFAAAPPHAVAEKAKRARLAIAAATALLARGDLRPQQKARCLKVASAAPDALPVATVDAMFRLYRDATGLAA